MIEYWANVVVLRLYGLRAEPARVRALLEAEIADGIVDWSDTTWYEIDPRTLDETIRRRVVPVTGDGIWYRSGRMFFPAESQ